MKLGLTPWMETNFIAQIITLYAERLTQAGNTLKIQLIFLALQGKQWWSSFEGKEHCGEAIRLNFHPLQQQE